MIYEEATYVQLEARYGLHLGGHSGGHLTRIDIHEHEHIQLSLSAICKYMETMDLNFFCATHKFDLL